MRIPRAACYDVSGTLESGDSPNGGSIESVDDNNRRTLRVSQGPKHVCLLPRLWPIKMTSTGCAIAHLENSCLEFEFSEATRVPQPAFHLTK